ncbi:MAG TPA: AAA family ATPase [Beijerinckiaceae bacterium]|jgi:DNA-binding CsgD family transcriptional regulator/tetratricopeptide (TPR) repeat protein
MLLERERWLDALGAAREAAAAGHGRTVLVEGEAGIGKTSLLRAFADRAAADARVSWGWCEALFTPRPLGPLYDMAGGFDAGVRALLDQTVAPERLFPALLGALQNSPKPVVLIFEDVHWADNATLDLIKYLGRRIALLRAVLVLTARSDEVGADHPLGQVLGDLPSAAVTRLRLEPLSLAAVAELAQSSGRSGAELHGVTAGNPFFVTELLASGENEENRLPASVRDAVWSRLSRLAAGERELLETVSILPGSVEVGVVRTLLGAEADGLVDRCVARGVLRRDAEGGLTFRHELARQATLERLSPSLQRSLHAKVGAALAAHPRADTVALLARRVHHAAGAGDGALVVGLAPRAAEQASRLGAHQQAASYLGIALEYVDGAEPAVVARLHEDWAYEAGLALRDCAAIVEAHERAITLWRALGAADKVSLNLRRLSRIHWHQGQGEEAERCCDLAVAVAESIAPGPELAMAYSTRSQLNMLRYRFDEAIAWGRRAIALADELGELETRIHASNNVASSLLFAGLPGGRELMEDSLSLALLHGFHDHTSRAYVNFAEHAVVSDNFPLAERLLAEGIAFAARHDLDATTQYLLGRQAQLRMQQGRFHEARTVAEGVVGMERLPVVMQLPALTVLGRVRVRLGAPDGEAPLRRALAEALLTGEAQRIVPVRFALAEAAWLAGRLDAARAELSAVVAKGARELRPCDLGELAIWWQRCGMPEDFDVDPSTLPVPRARELAGDPSGAAAEWERLGLPYEAGLSLLQVTGPGAGAALARAVAILDGIEARPAATLARRRAQRLGVAGELPKPRRGPYTAARQHPLGLTANEQLVLGLIAQGKSNKEAARELARSPKTIEHQVSAVLGKFRAANRMEVMLRLRAEPWLLTAADPARRS